MSSWREVYSLRREGQIHAAYALGRERMAAPGRDERDVQAFGWCLIDLIKAHSGQDGREELAIYVRELQELTPPDGDDILTKARQRALSLVQDGGREVMQAKEHSKKGQYRQAVAIYSELHRRGALTAESHANFGWDLYKATRELLGKSVEELPPVTVAEAKRNLNSYLKLSVDRPSLLHSVFLQLAHRLASANQLKLLTFARLWGLEHLRLEDFERFTMENGKTTSSLAEKVVLKAAKEATETGEQGQIDYIMPLVDRMLTRFPDNHWLQLSKVKLLRESGRLAEARSLAISFAKTKTQEYWTWDLLGDLQENPADRLACYCKALACSQDDNFVSRVREKLARELLHAGHVPEAKGEILRILEHKNRAGHRVPVEVQNLTAMDWYASTEAVPPKPGFYTHFASSADELLFFDLPWIDACLGETFTIEGQDSKPRRKLYLRTGSLPAEVAVPEGKVKLRWAKAGQPIRVKADFDPQGERRFTLYAISERRDGAPFDIFPETVGVIHHLNVSKGVLHFTAGREAQGTFPIAEYKGRAAVGAFVSLKLATFQSRKGGGVRALMAEATVKTPGAQVYRQFQSPARVRNGLGFTDDNIFIPPDLVADSNLDNDDIVSGVAIQSFDKKKGDWGWKAILATKSDIPDNTSGTRAAS